MAWLTVRREVRRGAEVREDGGEEDVMVVYVTLNRPRKANAITEEGMVEVIRLCAELQRDVSVAVVVFRGAGRLFCGGADLQQRPGLRASSVPLLQRRHAARIGTAFIAAVQGLHATTIAVVQGCAIGGGLGLLLACDLRVVMADAVLCFPEIGHGIPLAWGLTAMLDKEVGRGLARRMIKLGDKLNVDHGFQLGVITRVARTSDELAAKTSALIDAVLRHPRAQGIINTQFHALQAKDRLGDVTATDSDLLVLCPPPIMSKL